MTGLFETFFALLRAELRTLRNRVRFMDVTERRFRNLMLFLGVAVFLLIGAGSFRVFNYLLNTMIEAPELGGPLVLRLLEMTFLLFFVMLFISSLSVTLSVLYLDPEVRFLLTTPVRRTVLIAERMLVIIVRASWFVVFAGIAMLGGLCLSIPGDVTPVDRLVDGALPYLLSLMILVLYLIPPVVAGVAATTIIIRYVPAKRAKSTLLVLTVIALSLIVVGIRGMAPERLINPRIDPDIGIILEAVEEPAAPWLPSSWAAKAVFRQSNDHIAAVAVFSALSFIIGLAFVRLWHENGIQRILCGDAETRRAPRVDVAGALSGVLPERIALTAKKDLLLFWRDPTQWSQLIVLIGLVIIYAFNFQQLRGEFPSVYLRDVLSFVNLVMAGFILVAVANRFVFSAISLEGRAIWLLRSSPYDIEQMFRAKAYVAFLPLLILAQVITWSANEVMDVSSTFVFMSVMVVFLMTITLTSMGVGLGAIAPRFDLSDPAQIGMTQSGIVFMALGLGYVILFIGALATQVFIAWKSRFFFVAPTGVTVFLPIIFTIVLHACAVILPWHFGIKRIRNLEVYV